MEIRQESLNQSIAQKQKTIELSIGRAESLYSDIGLEHDFSAYVNERVKRYKDVNVIRDELTKKQQWGLLEQADHKFVSAILGTNPPREWILLKSFQGHRDLTATYGMINQLELQDSELAQALKTAQAIEDRDSRVDPPPTRLLC